MIERSAPPPMRGSRAPDIERMRATASTVLGDDEQFPRFDDLAEAAERLRGHLQVLIPVVEESVQALPANGPNRTAMQTDVENARACMQGSPGCGLVSATGHVRSLARELRVLCDRYETLTGATTREPT